MNDCLENYAIAIQLTRFSGQSRPKRPLLTKLWGIVGLKLYEKNCIPFVPVTAACYLPALVVDNDQLSAIMDTSDEWIYTRTGIKRRLSYLTGKQVTLQLGHGSMSGIVQDIDDQGCLLLASDGKILHINSGEVTKVNFA